MSGRARERRIGAAGTEARRLKRRLVLVFVLAIGLPAALLSYGSVRAIRADRAELDALRRSGLEALAREAAAQIEAEVRERSREAFEALGPRSLVAAVAALPEAPEQQDPACIRIERRVERLVAPFDWIVQVFVLDARWRPLLPPVATELATSDKEPFASTVSGGERRPAGLDARLERLEARARIERGLEEARLALEHKEIERARALLTELAGDLDDLEGAARARLALARLLVDAHAFDAAAQHLALLSRVPRSIRDRDGVPLAVRAILLAADMAFEQGQTSAGLDRLLELYARLLDGVYGRIDPPLFSVLEEVRSQIVARLEVARLRGPDERWVERRRRRFRALEEEVERWLRRLENQARFLALLPDLRLALEVSPPPFSEVAFYTNQGAGGARLIACKRVAAVHEGGLPYVVGVVLDLEALAESVLEPVLQSFARAHGVALRVFERGGRVVSEAAPFGGEEQPGAQPAVEVAIASFETLLPFWRLELRSPRGGELRALARTWLQIGFVALLVVIMVLGGHSALRAAQRSIELAALKAEFVANVSHELRTPLTAIRMYAELLQRNRKLDPERRAAYLRTILTETDRLHALIDDILGFARLEDGSVTYRSGPVDAERALASVLEELRARLQAEGVAIETEVEPNLPPVWSDRRMFEIAIRNLIVNAINYSPPDRKSVSLRLRRGGEKALLLEVADRGLGMDETERARLFDRFYRGEAARELGVPGSGLGLALVDRVVTDHGGRIEVESSPGEGSTVRLWLPVAARAEAVDEA